MPKIAHPELQEVMNRFEELVQAVEQYRDVLDRERPATYRTGAIEGRGRFPSRPKEAPPYGTREFDEFAYNRQLVKNLERLNTLMDLFEGEVFDRIRQLVDGLGTLESTRKGGWV